MAFTNMFRSFLRRFPSSSATNRVILTSAGIIGLGVVVGVNLLPVIDDKQVVNEFVGHEYQTGSIQTIAGATADGSIFTKSGVLLAGPIENPYFQFSSTGAQSIMGRVPYDWPLSDGAPVEEN